MQVAGSTAIDLAPQRKQYPTGILLELWQRADFSPEDCADLSERWMKRFHVPDDLFNFSAITFGGLVSTNRYLFPKRKPEDDWEWRVKTTAGNFSATIPWCDVGEVAGIIRGLGRFDDADYSRNLEEALGAKAYAIVNGAISDVLAPGINLSTMALAPGIYRLEHASVLIQGRHTKLLIDPQCYSNSWTTAHGAYPTHASLDVDGVLITHGHSDHWHLPSVLRHLKHTAEVIVPEIPSVNVLSPENLLELLELSGQRSLALPWNNTTQIGEFKIEALPFYGEQPTCAVNEVPDGVRNWGNCYRVWWDDQSVVILADTGADPLGDIREVIQSSARRNGPITYMLSCCLTFPEVINIGLPDYFLTVPFDVARQIYIERKNNSGNFRSITSGLHGVASLCELGKCRYFLPYAHGFSGLNMPPIDFKSYAQTEAQLMDHLERRLLDRGISTQVVHWQPGSHFPFK